MSSLKEVCSGLPVDPLPSPKDRDPFTPHAPARKLVLTEDERKVSITWILLKWLLDFLRLASAEERAEIFSVVLSLDFGTRICQGIDRMRTYLYVSF